ncbi:hypothetical protein [Streptomyces microflavus]|uniref:hypothetical protein n=1 Tax=Streptomyces microflavus TaxID=1919 RepID=UPI0033BE15A1
MSAVRGARRKQIAAQKKLRLETAEEFVNNCWEVLGVLPYHYDCYLTCGEADAMEALLRVFGADEAADHVRDGHASDDECGERHHIPCDRCREEESK